MASPRTFVKRHSLVRVLLALICPISRRHILAAVHEPNQAVKELANGRVADKSHDAFAGWGQPDRGVGGASREALKVGMVIELGMEAT